LPYLADSSVSSLSTATPPTVIYPLSLHDALPISRQFLRHAWRPGACDRPGQHRGRGAFSAGLAACHGAPRRKTPAWHRQQASPGDRKSTRLNSSHVKISYAVFCLKKKKKKV